MLLAPGANVTSQLNDEPLIVPRLPLQLMVAGPETASETLPVTWTAGV
jgi:hypothetical protein